MPARSRIGKAGALGAALLVASGTSSPPARHAPAPPAAARTEAHFASDSSKLGAGDAATLARLGNCLAACPGPAIHIEGYADSTGPAPLNEELSRRRAQAARDALVARGVPPGRIRILAMGSANPAASNQTAAGRAQNRRVEIHVTSPQESAPRQQAGQQAAPVPGDESDLVGVKTPERATENSGALGTPTRPGDVDHGTEKTDSSGTGSFQAAAPGSSSGSPPSRPDEAQSSGGVPRQG